MKLLFVCLGNICRSPTAEGVVRRLLDDAGLEEVEVDSCGTGDWHVGDRARAAPRLRPRSPGARLPGAVGREVPDPWHHGPAAFDEVLDLVEAGGRALVAALPRV